jgi:hypothetical protein
MDVTYSPPFPFDTWVSYLLLLLITPKREFFIFKGDTMLEEKLPLPYDQFKAAVVDINTRVDASELVGQGAESTVWRVRLALGDYAVKIAKENSLNARGRARDRGLMTKARIEGGVMALGVSGLEQIESGSIDDYVAIFQFVDGVRLTDFTADAMDMITREQKERFMETVAKTTERGLVFDSANPSGANAFYSAERGFTLIDYTKAWWPVEYKENLSYALQSLGPVAVRAFNFR